MVNGWDLKFNGYMITHEGAFVARFKDGRPGAKAFMGFLKRNFTPEEYFGRLNEEAPLEILESKGYVQPHVKRELRRLGLPETQEGFAKMIQLHMEERRRRWAQNQE